MSPSGTASDNSGQRMQKPESPIIIIAATASSLGDEDCGYTTPYECNRLLNLTQPFIEKSSRGTELYKKQSLI